MTKLQLCSGAASRRPLMRLRMRETMIRKIWFVCIVLSWAAWAKGARYDIPPILTPKGVPAANVQVILCAGSGAINGATCSPQTQGFSGITLTTPCPQGFPVTLAAASVCQSISDGLGNAGFWLAPGTYIYCLNGTNINGQCYNLTLPLGATSAGVAGFTNAGVFTNTQQNEYLTSSLNGLNFGNMFNGDFGGNFATNAIAGGVVIPGSSAVNMGTGLGGYVQNYSPGTSFGVGVLGLCDTAVTNAKCEGGNFVSVSHNPAASTEVVGAELDTNPANAADIVEGIQLNGAWSVQPTTASAIFV